MSDKMREALEGIYGYLETQEDRYNILGPIYDMKDDIKAALQQPESEPVAHVFPDDLKRLKASECSATVYSVKMGDPDRGETVALSASPQVPEGLKRYDVSSDAFSSEMDESETGAWVRFSDVRSILAPSIAEKAHG